MSQANGITEDHVNDRERKNAALRGVQSWLGPREGWPSSNLLSVNASLYISHRKQEHRNEEMKE